MLLDNSNQRVFSLAFKMAGMINFMNNFGSLSRRGWYLPAHICSYAYLIPAERSRQEVEPRTSLVLQKWHSILAVWTGEWDGRTNSSVDHGPCKREGWSCPFQPGNKKEALNLIRVYLRGVDQGLFRGVVWIGSLEQAQSVTGFFRWTCHH